MEGEQAAAQQQQPVKRKRGRPRKSESAPTTPGTDTTTMKPKKQRKRKGDADAPAPSIVDVTMIGQQVTGMLEGTFDAGYLLSVRVGTSDTILRGVVFGPGLSVPLTKVNDVAPGVKQVRREEKPIAKPAAVPAKPPPVAATSFSPFVVPAGPSAAIPPTSAVLESAAALFGNSIAAAASAGAPSSGLVAALQQLPGGGYTPDPATFAQAASFQPESVKSL